MRQKRTKSSRKVMSFYCNNFSFRLPYQLLLDADFIISATNQNLDFDKRLLDVVQGQIKPMITQCSIAALYATKNESAINLAKSFERRMCNHLPTKPELDCIAGVVGPENKHKYVVATQDVELRKKLRLVPGVPLVYISRSIVLLETPSEKSLNKKKEMETIKLHAPASELALLSSSKHPVSKSLNSTTLIDSHLAPSASSSKLPPPSEAENATEDQAQKPKKKKKGPSGPNPLSVRKKKPTPASNEKVEKGKHNGKQSEKQAPEKRKRQRDDTDEVKSLSSRTSVRQSAAGAQGEGEVASGATTITEGPRKRKRRRTGKKVESGESTAAAALVAEA